MPYKVFRGKKELRPPVGGVPLDTLEAARGLVEYDIERHPGAVPSPFGGIPRITWTWVLDALEARSEDTGQAAYTIRPVPGT